MRTTNRKPRPRAASRTESTMNRFGTTVLVAGLLGGSALAQAPHFAPSGGDGGSPTRALLQAPLATLMQAPSVAPSGGGAGGPTLLAPRTVLQAPQDTAANGGGSGSGNEPKSAETPAVDAESLRGRIRDMRMNLLLGGDQVRSAEAEARQFYGGKIEHVDGRLDTLHSDLSEKRPGYELALDRALQAKTPAEKRAALREASTLRSEISAIEGEAAQLGERRDGLVRLVGAIDGRDRERERLVAQLEASSAVDETFALPLASIGLAPAIHAEPASSPLEDTALVDDLLGRDPVAGRGLLFELDPFGYWQRFPLQPPASGVRAALTFPLPDLPGSR